MLLKSKKSYAFYGMFFKSKKIRMKNIHVISTNKPSRLIIYSTLVNDFRLLAEPTKDWKHKKHIYITNSEEIKEGDCCLYSTKEDTNNEESIPIICKITRILNSQDGLLYEGSTGLVTQYPTKLSKIILTTDPDLIKDGVQAIDDEFLEWFVKNPSCDYVEITDDTFTVGEMSKLPLGTRNHKYKIIIPQEKPKQLTDLEIAIKLEEIEREEPKQECTCGVCDNCEEQEMFQILKEAKEYLAKQKTLEEAAEKYSKRSSSYVFQEAHKRDFINGARYQSERMYSEQEVFELTLKALDLGMTIRQDQLNGYSEKSGKDSHKEWFEQFKKK